MMSDESVVSERRPADNRFRGWISAAAWIGIPLCLIGGLRACFLWIPQVPFDPGMWCGDEARAKGDYRILEGRGPMLRDLLTNHLPGKNRQQIEGILGPSHTHESARIPETGTSYFFQDYEWDLLYTLGYEVAFVFDHKGQIGDLDPEYLIIRLGEDGLFESWYVFGSRRWPKIVGREASSRYRTRR